MTTIALRLHCSRLHVFERSLIATPPVLKLHAQTLNGIYTNNLWFLL